jgi:hypothetical protein
MTIVALAGQQNKARHMPNALSFCRGVPWCGGHAVQILFLTTSAARIQRINYCRFMSCLSTSSLPCSDQRCEVAARQHFRPSGDVEHSPFKLTYGKVRYRPFRNPIDNEVAAP